jgi:hypothetical protein
MTIPRLILTAIFGVSLSATALAAGPYYEVKYEASTAAGELQMPVTYTVWLPPGVNTLRGVIVHQHGCGTGACQGGATAAYDLHWQELARRYDCALLGPSYGQEEKQNCRLWCDPRNGSDKTFLRALDDLAKESQHPELATVPWCLWGHSGGGFWASLMMTLHPERTVAVWCRSGTAFVPWEKGEIPKPNLAPAVYEIPVMCNPGVKERDDKRFAGAWNGCLEMFRAYRKAGAPIGFAPDPRTGHECGDCRYLAIPWFAACLELRLPEKASTEQKLRVIDQAGCWLAKELGDTPYAAAKFPGKPLDAVWLPNETVAQTWQQYVKSGEPLDKTAPPTPTNLRLLAADSKTTERTLVWESAVDFESGLAGFVISLNGKEIAQLPEKPNNKLGRGLYQPVSYHDTPEKNSPGTGEAPLFRYTLNLPTATVTEQSQAASRYEIQAVNTDGMKSGRCQMTLSK